VLYDAAKGGMIYAILNGFVDTLSQHHFESSLTINEIA
tara:strand:+ start:114 stop:227 length:114 start_codon:yes stop_codon:yes gene_type:complete